MAAIGPLTVICGVVVGAGWWRWWLVCGVCVCFVYVEGERIGTYFSEKK